MADTSSYGTLRTDFLAMLARRDCTSAMADAFIAKGIKRVQRAVGDLPAGEKSVVITISADTYNGRLVIPSDYIRIKDITYIDASGRPTVLRRAPLAETLDSATFGAQGIVTKYVRQGNSWVFGALPLNGDSVRIDYYSEYVSVSQAADDNILLDIAEDAVLYGALTYAGDRWNDKRGPLWEQRFTQILSDLEEQAEDDETSGDAAVAQAFFYPPDYQ